MFCQGNGNEGRRRLGGLHGPFVDRSDSGSSSSSDGDIEWLNDSSSSSSDSDGDDDDEQEVNVFEIDQAMRGKSVGWNYNCFNSWSLNQIIF